MSEINKWKLPKTRTDLPEEIPFSDDLSILSTSVTVAGKAIPNRFVYQPMEGCDSAPDGAPGELTIRRYRRFAAGGPGLIWFEATAVLPEARANPHQAYITPQNRDAFAALVEEIKEICVKENGYEPLVICQLTHSGRYSKPHGTPDPLIAYHNPIFEQNAPISDTAIVTDDYLAQVGEALVEGARLAESAGFDGADIKSCHRYLLSELLSAYTREGNYGGSYENRTRLFKDAVAGAVGACGKDFIITSRFNAFDGFPHPYGFGATDTPGVPDLTEATRLVGELQERGMSLFNVTMGNPYVNPEVNRPTVFGTADPSAAMARLLTGAGVLRQKNPGAVVISSGMSYGGILSPQIAAGCIEAGLFDLAGFGRLTFAYPDLARDIVKNGLFNEKQVCLTCGKCTELMRSGRTPGCVIRDTEIYGTLYKELLAERKNQL